MSKEKKVASFLDNAQFLEKVGSTNMSKQKKVASFLDNAQFLEKVGPDNMSKQKKVASFLDDTQFLEKVGVHSVSNATLQKGSPSLWNVSAAVSDDGLLVTNINQTQDLMRLKDTAMLFAGLKSSDDWIQVYGLKPLQLSFDDLMKKGSIVVNPDDPTESIEFTKESVNYFESELRKTIALYDRRIEWLLQDSRKIFGMIRGDKVGVLIDTSDVSCGPRLQDFQRDLLSVIDEQLLYMKKLYFLSFGTNISLLWEKPRFIDEKVLDEARQWVLNLKPSGGCNLLKALKKALTVKELNSLVIVVGSCPDQASEILSEYIQECTVGRKLLVHTVTYDCSNQVPPGVVRSIAEDVGGYYHCYSSKRENCDSTDIQLILLERQKAKELLNIISEIYQGRMGDTLFNVMKQGSMECLKLPSETSLPKPPKHECPLAIQIPSFLAQTSAEWLKTNGLKARKLSLYQVLAPNAFSPVEEFVPVLRKMVSSTLHEKAMTQFEWHDGTIKNIHVDPPILYDYQKRLGRLVRMYERRIDWLSTASRRIWGTVCEKRIVILIDVSKTNAMYIIHIQHSLRLLLEEQMSSKDFFNIIAFGNDIKAWHAEMVPLHLDNLQRAWSWVLTLQCEGTRNLMTALRRAVEIDFKDKDKHKSQSIYLLTTGVPDQEKHAICSYLAEVCGGCDLKLHVCLFSVDGFSLDDIPPRYASLNETAAICKEFAQTANGRFHWFGETGIYESDDISIILSEMEKAVNYSHKCALLVGSLRQRSGSHLANQLMPEGDLTMLEPQKKSRPQRLPFPKPTALTLARMNFRDQPDGARNGTMKALLWRPPSAKAEIPPVPSKENYLTSGKKKHNFKSKKRSEVSLLLFYADKGKKVGAVYKKYSKMKNVKKQIPVPVLPFEEEICSSKAWLSRFSIKKLKLDLPSLVFGPECVHQKEMVASLHKQVSAKYCDIFPSVEIQGIVKHLQIQPKDLEVYIEQMERVLRCYVRRVQWLLSGSRRLFGVVLEANVCILIDTSGSMDRSLQEVTKELTSLIWEQLRKNNVKFSLISFAEDVDVWQECLVEATNETCHDAVQWLSTFHAHGNTSILKALRRAFSFPDVEALYVLTDGKPDTSCSLVLKEIEMLLKKRAIIIHTISFNCSDRAANDFLKKLAFQTGGRYHRCHGDVDGQMAAHRLLSEGFKDEDDPAFPLFEGDDLKKLVDEIAKARSYLTQAKFFKSLLEKKNVNQKDRCP